MIVLIVDDNDDDREVLRYLVENKGHTALEAEDGFSALREAARTPPDLIISDALMPVMDGFELLKSVKDDPKLRHIPFIFYSATYQEYQDVRLALSLGADAYLIKPTDPVELWAEIEKILATGTSGKTVQGILIKEDAEYLKQYNRVVASKLDKKVRDLEELLLRRAVAEEKLREANLALAEQVRFNDILMQAMPIAVFYKDAEGRYLGCNREYGKITGVAPEDIRGKTEFDVWPRERALLYHEQDNLLLRNPAPQVYEHRMRNAAGEMIDVLYRKDVFRDRNGRVSGIIGVFEDITERKRAETALWEREEFIRKILETVDEGFIVVDRECRILSANRSYAASAGLPRERLIGRFCYEASHHLDRPCFQDGEDCPVRRTFETGGTHTASHVHIDERGGRRYVEIKSYPMTDASGTVVSAIETISDVTEKKQLEEQLRHAQKIEALGTLAGGVAHDFNNILSVLVGYGALMETCLSKDDPALPYLREMRAATDRATQLTRALLIFGRKQVSELKPVNVNELIKGMRNMVLRLIGEDIETQLDLAEEPLVVRGDYGQLEQVFVNLATNARDAMPGGGVLGIATRRVELDDAFLRSRGFGKRGSYALVTVSDTGRGMDERTRERIFEPFFTTKEQGKGTGLGLSIVYGIVEQHQGHIRCASEPGRGTTFEVYLPTIRETVAEKAEEALADVRGGRETVLVADDDAMVRRMHKELLEKRGYTVLEATDGEDAVRVFAENRDLIALVLLDAVMPKKSGMDAYEEIRGLRPDARVLFISGYADDVIQRKKIIEERLEIIQKPAAPRTLLGKIRELLDRKRE